MTVESKSLLIGVDVGGTNTDSVLLDPSQFDSPGRGVLAWHKAASTPDVSVGIVNAIEELFKQSPTTKPNDITSVTIGTTHFINAVIEQDASRLVPVAVLRLCGPYSRSNPPCCDFPSGLANLVNAYSGYLDGGYKIDGAIVKPIRDEEILEHAKAIKDKGISSIVVNGNFSPLNNAQELYVKSILEKEIPDAHIIMSHEGM